MKRALQVMWGITALAIGIPAATFFFAMMYGTLLYWGVSIGLVAAVAWAFYLKGKEAGREEARRPPPIPRR